MPSVIAIAIAPDADLSDPSTWVFEDVTEHAQKPGIDISYGRRDEGSLVDTTSVTLQLDNRDGRFTRLNPLSPYYRRIRSGTPIRITITGGTGRLLLAEDGARCGAPFAASHNLAGDLDLRVEYDPAIPEPLVPGVAHVSQSLLRRWATAVVAQSAWLLNHHGQTDTSFGGEGMRFQWRDAAGVFGPTADSGPYAPGGFNGRRAVRITLEMDIGGSHRVTWYHAPTIAGPWRQFKQDTRAGATSIQAITEPFMVGASGNGTPGNATITYRGTVYAVQLRDGIDGTLVASPDFTTAALGTGGFTDAQGNVWALDGGGTVSDAYELFQGFVAEWPTRWDQSGKESWVPIAANGQLRRLQRRDQQAAKSVVHRMVLAELRDG